MVKVRKELTVEQNNVVIFAQRIFFTAKDSEHMKGDLGMHT